MEEAYSIELDRVSVTKRGRPILTDLKIDLSRGLTALLGRNGAGKTTLMRVLAGVQPPTSGLVTTVSGQLYGPKPSMEGHLKVLGWVPQGPGYPARMKVGSFVEYAAWLKCMEPSRRATSVISALKACKADSLTDRALRTLSGGERQRVILASAIVGNPKILILDEPTTGLDPAQRESYLALLRDLSETTTVLYSTHLVDDVVRTATRILVLDQGSLSGDLHGPDLDAPTEQLGDRLRQAVIESTDRNS